MPTKQTPTDVFMQFASWKLTWPSVTTTLVETKKNTGLSIRGGLMWLVHLIEVFGAFLPALASSTVMQLDMALSTVPDATVIPTAGDKGFVGGVSSCTNMATSGGVNDGLPLRLSYLPPVPLASPRLSAYIIGSQDMSPLDGLDVYVRVGYTTSPLDSRAYAEIAETWAQV